MINLAVLIDYVGWASLILKFRYFYFKQLYIIKSYNSKKLTSINQIRWNFIKKDNLGRRPSILL